jgi:hypothetical protein
VKDPVDHILRPRLPWRPTEGAITECGYDASKVKTLSRPEYFARLKDMGSQRSAMITCMTCSHTVSRWATWEDDPRKAMGREIEWETAWRTDRGHQLRDELLAIEALISAHPDEFRQAMADIQSRREWLERKAKNERAQ